MVAGDDARFFKPMNALRDRRRREADLPAEFGERDARILLQRFQNLPGNCVEFESFGSGLGGPYAINP